MDPLTPDVSWYHTMHSKLVYEAPHQEGKVHLNLQESSECIHKCDTLLLGLDTLC